MYRRRPKDSGLSPLQIVSTPADDQPVEAEPCRDGEGENRQGAESKPAPVRTLRRFGGSWLCGFAFVRLRWRFGYGWLR